MASSQIHPIKLELTSGTYYTLWAPEWQEDGKTWEAFLGTDKVNLFTSPEAMLDFIESEHNHDLATHPMWNSFSQSPQIYPDEKHTYDLVWTPALLAEEPMHQNTSALARNFAVAKSLASVMGAQETRRFFTSYSITQGPSHSYTHYTGKNGPGEWNALGTLVHEKWDGVLDSLEDFNLPA